MGFPRSAPLSKYVLPFISLLRKLRRIFPMNLLLQVYKSYIQPRLDYGITLYGCSTQKNIDFKGFKIMPCRKADNGEFRQYKLSWDWPC